MNEITSLTIRTDSPSTVAAIVRGELQSLPDSVRVIQSVEYGKYKRTSMPYHRVYVCFAGKGKEQKDACLDIAREVLPYFDRAAIVQRANPADGGECIVLRTGSDGTLAVGAHYTSSQTDSIFEVFQQVEREFDLRPRTRKV